jgi:hypothetical protein
MKKRNISTEQNMEDELDISWILEQERLENIDHNCWREPLTEIGITTLYINKDKEIETIEREKMDVSGISILTKEKIIQIVQSKKKYTPTTKYILKETLWFHIDVEPENIQHFSEHNHSFLHIYPILEDIPLKPSIFIFHRLNTLFFFFYETQLVDTKPRSIHNLIPHNRTKKKVEIQINENVYKNIKTTRKKMT